ncbi:MAG: peptide chain release factor N(5)-glutamine methyltransferase [Bacteroidales bacterium]|nr:peptide chain release factor N(5)-glutamine methyltransferase [Bacteroidales bacterium]
MLLKGLIKEGTDIISSMYPEREAREMVFAYLESVIGTRRHTHIIEPEYQVDDEAASQAVEAFRRMASGEPLQYVTGKAYFYGREFNVTPDVLIPRPETELLCRAVIDFVKMKSEVRILDLCTGSGCIAWTLALEIPGAQVMAVDISEGALAVASAQDFADEMSRTCAVAPDFLKADVLSCHPEPSLCHPERSEGSLPSHFDIIVSNPPYVMDSEKALMRKNVLDHEPHLALFVPDDDPLLFYRAVAQWALQLLKPGGFGIVEINEALGEETAEIYRRNGFSAVTIIKDLNDKDRFVSFRR